ncbi:MAG: DUF2199 domain-containing protein [Lachnospiraceae bacterium]|nr:DUF2199 domain-containing protein [Lachnospiraceae bacterium]
MADPGTGDADGRERMMRMQANIYADCHENDRGYQGAALELPATPYEIRDALQRARVPEGGGYTLEGSGDWPDFLWSALFDDTISGENALEELNLLAHAVSRMDEMQAGIFEGAAALRMEETGKETVTLKELINLSACLDDYEFQPGVTNDASLGRACMEGGMLDIVENLPDGAAELLDPAKVGKALRDSDHGTFTPRGYVYQGTAAVRQDFYDGEHLPACGEDHQGLLSLRIEKLDAPDADSNVWLELPADEKAIQWALLSAGEESFDACRIAEAKSIIPAFQYQLAGDEDIGKLNILAGRLQELQREAPDDLMLIKYKAVLELEQCSDLDMALDISANLDCYYFAPAYISPEAFGEYILQNAGADTDDPAFRNFDFGGYGTRKLTAQGYVFTPYGAVSRNGQEFVHEYTEQGQASGQDMAMQ